jgi:hypothetical protein
MTDKPIPNGVWIYISSLPAATTAEEIANHFCESGLAVPPENVSLRASRPHCTAVVSVPRDEVMNLVSWALNQNTFHGEQLNIQRAGGAKDGRL